MNMQVAKNTVVTHRLPRYRPDGTVVDEGREPIVYLHGGRHLPKIERRCRQENRRVGPGQAAARRGVRRYDADLVQIEPREQFPKSCRSACSSGCRGDDDEDFIIYRVTDIADGKVVLTAITPAGMALVFTCTVTGVRNASEEEVGHGHVHGHGDDCA